MRTSNNILLITTVLVSASLQAQTITRDNGSPVGDNQNSITAGENGPVLLQDVQLIQNFNVLQESVFLSVLFMLVVQERMANLLQSLIFQR